MQTTRCAVIGVGHLGKFHAQKYAQLPQAKLIGVCDINQVACEKVAKEYATQRYLDYRELLNQVDAVSIVVPTSRHYDIAKDFIAHGVHVLIEKPITQTLEQAQTLIELADKHQVTLQVGHIERFNPAQLALEEYLTRPIFIESQRLTSFKPRNTDVNVVLDLMIHDIDLLQTIVKSPIKTIDAQGAPVLTEQLDIATARITFENYCVANVTASRISFQASRSMRIFQPDSYISIDYQNNKFAVFNKGKGEMFPGIPEITSHESVFEKSDALKTEIAAFLTAIQTNTSPQITGQDGYQALETAQKITQLIQEHITNITAEL